MFDLISSLFIGYLFGCIITGYYVGKLIGKLDIREHGSGNAGTTNTIRVLGWKAGTYTFLGDLFKALLGVLLAKYLFGNPVNQSAVVAYAGIGVILGHNWPVFMNFKGGKGFASLFGVLAVMNLWIAIFAGAFAISMIAITRYVSLTAMTTCVLTPFLFLLFDKNIEFIIFGVLITILSIFKHRANIKRLLAGTESKIGRQAQN